MIFGAKHNSSKEEFLKIHYKREDSNYKDWCLWLWEFPQGAGREFAFNGIDEFGGYALYPLSLFSRDVKSNNIGLIVKGIGGWEHKDGSSDRRIRFSKISKDENNIYHAYLVEGNPVVYVNDKLEVVDEIKIAKFVDESTILVTANEKFKNCNIYKNGELFVSKEFEKPVLSTKITLKNKTINFESIYESEVTFDKNNKVVKEYVTPADLYVLKDFCDKYNYDGELGAIYSKEKTTFKVWTPISKKVVVRIYKNGTPELVNPKKGSDKIYLEVEMKKSEKGVFSAVINEDLAGKFYTYVVTNPVYKEKEIVDPYAKAVGVNGARGMVVDFEKTNPIGFNEIKPHKINPRHLTVYETHVVDLTSSDTWSKQKEHQKFKRTFLGACLEGTTYTENGVTVKTGFDHIKELGVNAVQLLPIFDHANNEVKTSFNWGYNPLNYNSLDGSYSTNPYDGYIRIIEFKQLVKAYHDAGINIIMDVVFNHVNGAPGSNFDVLMPGYYFRYNEDRTLSNGSGCGNETASETYMFRKFMIDSVLFWAKEYKISGFRFDLMGLHDLETMEKLSAKLKDFDENIVIYGEPWCGGGSKLDYKKSAIQCNLDKFVGYGAFNDKIREAIPTWLLKEDAKVEPGTFKDLLSGLVGSIDYDKKGFSDPDKTVNYVSCHDNFTVVDRLAIAGAGGKLAERLALAMNSIVFTSNGIAFMLAGEEFLRTKYLCGNSYNASYKVNELDYSLKVKNYRVFKNFQKLIELKQHAVELALDKEHNVAFEVGVSEKQNILSYVLHDERNGREYKVFHANAFDERSLGSVNLMDYTLYFDTYDDNKKLSMYTKLNPYETIIAYIEK